MASPLCIQPSALYRADDHTIASPALCSGAGGVWVDALPTPSPLRSFTELASPAEKPQLEGLLGGQDTAANFGPQREPVRQQIHRMFLLRVKLMHFVNSLHNYIMTRVRVCPSTQFCHRVYICSWRITCNMFINTNKHTRYLIDCKCEDSTY